MNQLQLNLELANSEEIEYRGFTIVLHESVPKRITDRCKGLRNDMYSEFTETKTYWQSTIYKEGDKDSGANIACESFKNDVITMTKVWIDIIKFGEKEKYKYGNQKGTH